jgi:predicted  nucleic acid-binding Zn-ribbon protein
VTREEELQIMLDDAEDDLARAEYKIDEYIEKLVELSKTKEKLKGSIASIKWELNIED